MALAKGAGRHRLTLLHGWWIPLAWPTAANVPWTVSMLQRSKFEQARERMTLFANDYGLPDDQMQIRLRPSAPGKYTV